MPGTNALAKIFIRHYSKTESYRSPEKIESDRWLLPGIKFNRWLLLPASVMIQFCCGSLYAWSVFNKLIDTHIYGENRNMAPNTLYIAVGVAGISAAIVGPWVEKYGPKFMSLIGTSIFCFGHFITALGLYVKSIWVVYLGYGLFAGYGLGICYLAPVASLQKWFPDHRGLAAGFAVGGFGAGSIVVAKVVVPLVKSTSLPLTFMVLGMIYFIFMTIGSLVLRTPSIETCVKQEIRKEESNVVHSISREPSTSGGQRKEKSVQVCAITSQEISAVSAISAREYRLLYIAFLANALFGLVIISRLADMTMNIFDVSEELATTAVSINGGFNLLGRFLFPLLSDYIGRKCTVFIMLAIQVAILGCFSLFTTSNNVWLFLSAMWIVTMTYGAGFGVIPAFLSDLFGSNNTGTCYGIALTAWSLAATAGGLIYTAVLNHLLKSGYTPKDPIVYNTNVWWIFSIVLVGWFSLMFVRVPPKGELHDGTKKEIFRVHWINYIMHIHYSGGKFTVTKSPKP